MAKNETSFNCTSEPNSISNQIPEFTSSKIITLRGMQVILDKDLACCYQVETKRLNEQVRRNITRFPPQFMFQLTKEEWHFLRSQNATIDGRGRYSKYPPYAFTEYGVIMVAAILKSDVADNASVKVVEAFVAMRRFLASNAQVFQRLDHIEYKLQESDQKIEELYSKLEEKTLEPHQGIFYDGQIYDAYEYICSLLKKARTRIVLIDNYIDDSVLTMLDKRSNGVDATVFTQKVSNQLKLDIEKHNKQYPAISIMLFKKAHDRFLIIDDTVYLVGASLKDLGQKWFAVALLSAVSPNDLISRLNEHAISLDNSA